MMEQVEFMMRGGDKMNRRLIRAAEVDREQSLI
jgi:hypothetical protein